LKLNSDLVVLSGCETALGKKIRGEGFVGLTRGFMYAGAKAVIASLWRVEDAATAEFMRHFYDAMIHNDEHPAAALRYAKLKIADDHRWQKPYYWAAFVIQGDWR
jgi:CHAT domain-containing protein